MSTESPVQFLDFRLDLVRGKLVKSEEEVKLRPKAFETLRYLATNQGRLVGKPELMAVLWPGSPAATEDSLAHCIMEVRRALGESGQQLLRTVPARGYIFEVPSEEFEDIVPAITTPPRARILVAIAGAALLAGALLWWGKFRSDQEKARDLIPRIEVLSAQGKYGEAYDLAQRVLAVLPTEPRVYRLLNEFSDDLTVITEPAGAEVYLQRLGASGEERIGVSPVSSRRIARGEYILSIRKDGYGQADRTLSSALPRTRPVNRAPWSVRVEQTLRPDGKAPAGMVYVPNPGPYRLRAYGRPGDYHAELGAFFIDRFEVSNRDYQAFADAGGYRDLAKLVDKSGLPGPREWVGGKYPSGKEMLPVTGISWLEARSYCLAQGKDLPTAFQWEFAARDSLETPFGIVMPWGLLDGAVANMRGNFESGAPAAIHAFAFGMSPFGALNMAGNVAEWTRNGFSEGHVTLGSSWRQPVYQFARFGWRPADYAADDLGFRCTVLEEKSSGKDGAGTLPPDAGVMQIPRSTRAEFDRLKQRYEYQATGLDAKVESKLEGASWWRESLSFNGFAGERASAYLYLPKGAAPPFQVILYLGGAGNWSGVPVTTVMETHSGSLEPYVKLGRAVMLVNLKGFAGREPVGAYANLEPGSGLYRDIMQSWTIDMRRCVDYLESRPDINAKKIAFWNTSTTEYAGITAAVEGRFAAVVLVAAGLSPWLEHAPPEVDMHRFVPFIRPPKLMLSGKYDEANPETATAAPFFNLLGEPKKRIRFEGGHVPSPEVSVPAINPWLDAVLGPVSKRQ